MFVPGAGSWPFIIPAQRPIFEAGGAPGIQWVHVRTAPGGSPMARLPGGGATSRDVKEEVEVDHRNPPTALCQAPPFGSCFPGSNYAFPATHGNGIRFL
jgi:hypothetical protein